MASLVWVSGLLYARSAGWLEFHGRQPTEGSEPAANPNAPDKSDRAKRKKRPARSARDPQPARRAGGDSASGDDLGGPETRTLDADRSGGEEQLLDREIEQAFDKSFPQVRRCLILAASDEPVSGTLSFGLRISGSQGVIRVNLQGPSAITQGEAGDCLRKTARALRLRSFHGPDMIVHYPLTLH